MNIEEAKELVDNSKFYGKTSSVIKAEVRDIIDQLNQPKPEVPQCVADWIEECKEEDLTLSLAYDADAFGEVAKWLYDTNDSTNIDLFTQAWLAYPNITIEKEKLYTVEIPDPNHDVGTVILSKNKHREAYIAIDYTGSWKERKANHLTESEIRKDFDWAWQFAKEVTE
ncbi:DUF1642 domain-containing protein [Streptococcus pyogenes]|uniref:DUF1642 domain-containing protein n=1 Tax=Streptococcus pyogenes TaxID=1314 RepID=UPI0013307135|nr:DUF1642 domain-containing protein [Streptococcus pyogenes]